VELYPFPIPDLFVGQPLLVSGKFEGDWPDAVEICGILPDGDCELLLVVKTCLCLLQVLHLPATTASGHVDVVVT
jgi:hypothetical protein